MQRDRQQLFGKFWYRNHSCCHAWLVAMNMMRTSDQGRSRVHRPFAHAFMLMSQCTGRCENTLIPYQTNKVTAGRGGVFLSEEIELNLASTYSAKSAQMLCSSHGKEFILKLVYMLIIFTLMIYMVHWCPFFLKQQVRKKPLLNIYYYVLVKQKVQQEISRNKTGYKKINKNNQSSVAIIVQLLGHISSQTDG